MKFSFKYIASLAVAASATLVACNDLDTAPQGSHVTTDQKGEAVENNPGLASAGVVGIFSTINQFGAVYSSEPHCDIGWPGVMLFLDCIGPDLVSDNIGYNWFASSGDYNLGNNNNYVDNLSWGYAYKMILSANNTIGNIDPETTNDELKLFAAQGYASRAWAYFQLIQLYQTTYKGSESKPGVPLVTDLNATEAAVNGCPRATVQEVYDLIMSDVNKAVELLGSTPYGVDHIADTGAKRFFSLGAVLGLRARVELVMQNWQAAAADAAQAIAKSGATPLSIAEASVPGFNDISAHNWIWGIYIQEIDRVVTTGICNWPSHMGSFNYGYASAGAWRYVSKALFNEIPASDCRKGWFLDADGKSKNINAQQAAYVAQNGMAPYTQVKFAPYQGVLGTSTNACDIPMMRVEEMYLIQAEATAMGGDVAGGKQILESFVKTYRDPNFTSLASTAAELQEEVWLQRRIELFGEGNAYYDLLRLNKGLDRRGGGWAAEWVYNVPAPLKPFLIPNSEVEANKALGGNNDTWDKPTPVDDL